MNHSLLMKLTHNPKGLQLHYPLKISLIQSGISWFLCPSSSKLAKGKLFVSFTNFSYHFSCLDGKKINGWVWIFLWNLLLRLPGRTLASNQTIWLSNAHYADNKIFSRSLLAKVSFDRIDYIRKNLIFRKRNLVCPKIS